MGPHRRMTGTAKFVARHQMIAEFGKTGYESGDVAGNEHGVRIGPGDQESVHDVGAGPRER